MCGIAGIVTRDGSLPSEEMLERMSEAIEHRGPDGPGLWRAPGVGLAHRRLAIIDLSPSGKQPMHARSFTNDVGGRQTCTIVFNGEIYNYRALRLELEALGASFHSSSDTEVILEAYRAWGIMCLERLHGMFAFALWDGGQNKLLLARDRIGKKPLFYTTTADGHLAFASEIKALSSAVALKPDWQAVRLFLGLQYVPSPRTGFENVSQIPIGSYGIWDGKGLRVVAYHSYTDKRPLPYEGGVEKASGEIRRLLDEAVRLRLLASDVPVGAFLSGGIDSAAVVAFASKHVHRPLQTFTMGFPNLEMDERREAREIARHFGTEHEEFEARPDQLQALIDEIIVHYDAPYADSSALPLWLLSRETAKQIKVVLTGDGGDELFGGYRRYAAYEMALQMSTLPFVGKYASFLAGLGILPSPWARFFETIAVLKKDSRRAYGELFCGSYFSSARVSFTCRREFVEQTRAADPVTFIAAQMRDASLDAAMRFDLTSYLPDDLNVKMDRATMRFGLEARSPFLDQQLVAYAAALPLNFKVLHGKKKIVLKRALRGIVPNEVLTRKKRGFQVPLATWFRGPLAKLLHDRLCDPSLPLASLLEPQAVRRLIDENAAGADHGNRLWMLLALSTWLNQFG